RPAARPAKRVETGPAPEGLSFSERKRLDDLSAIIERLEAEIAKLTEFLAAPDLYTREPMKFQKATEAMAERQNALHKAETEWLELADRA
ncbi:MAG: ABC transporter ATP-binding protein, partial [Tabrizicola sp.]|nr:ABC transporter ATP-binding protein [Tabrizicola sp.]